MSAAAMFRIVLIQIWDGCPTLQTRLLHHEMANCVKVTVASSQWTAIATILIAWRGHLLLRHHTFTFLLLLLRIQQILLQFLRIEGVSDLLVCHFACARNAGWVVVGTWGWGSRRLPVVGSRWLIGALHDMHWRGRILLNLRASLPNEPNVVACMLLSLHRGHLRLFLLFFLQKILAIRVLIVNTLSLTIVLTISNTLIHFISFGSWGTTSLLWLRFLTRASKRDFFLVHSWTCHIEWLLVLLLLAVAIVDLLGSLKDFCRFLHLLL